MSTFEPTIGITSMDNIYMSSWGNGPSGSTAVIRCSGLIEMTALSEYSCENVYNPALPYQTVMIRTYMWISGLIE